MKRVHKLIISAVALVLCGVIAFVIGMSLLDWNFKKLDVTEYKAKDFKPTEQVSSVKLDIDSFPIQIVGGEETKLDYFEASNSTVSVTVNDGVLEIVEKRSYNPFKYGLLDFGRFDHPYVLTVAGDTELSFGGSNGDLTFVDVEFEKVKIDMTNLDADFRGCTIGELDIHADNLSLDMERCTLTEVKIDVDNCSVDVSNCNGGNVSIKTINTSVDFACGSFSSLTVVATNADISVERTSSKTIDLRATNGDISLERVTVDNLTVSAQNLSADIEIEGKRSDYTIKCSGRGMPNQNKGTTDKTITLSGTNNDVELIFV